MNNIETGSNAANIIGNSLQNLGWNQDEILEKIRERDDHTTVLVSRRVGAGAGLGDLHHQANPIETSLATENGQALMGIGLITQEIAEEFFIWTL